jgi:diacylglycerol O-acyltransferase / wax synthase
VATRSARAVLERLNSLDQIFLAVEDPSTPWNIGSLAIFEGPAPTLEELRNLIETRLGRVARCRQRVRAPRGAFGRALWIDDSDFDLARHVIAHSLPRQSDHAIEEFVVSSMARALDRAHPLWEVCLVNGLGDGQWALVAKVHHCMVDGIAGTELLTTFMDPDLAPMPFTVWTPARAPSTIEVLWFNVASGLSSLRTHAAHLGAALATPRSTWRHARQTLQAARRLWLPIRRSTTSLARSTADELQWRRDQVRLDDVARVREEFDATLNDVVAALVTRGFRELLISRGDSTSDRGVVALVPVSLRRPDERGRLDNRLANVHAVLPVDLADSRQALRSVQRQLDELKVSGEVAATAVVMHLGDYVPRALADAAARAIVRRQRKVEVVLSDVPGPATPRFLGASRLLAGYPFAPIAGHVGVTVAVWSYCDQLHFGVTGADASDLERLLEGVHLALDELADGR